MDERLEKIQRHAIPRNNGVFDVYHLRDRDYKYLIQQVEKVPELEDEIQNLKVYRNESSKFHVDLNEFLQQRHKEIPIKKNLGRHVVDVAITYIQLLEEENQRYEKILKFYAKDDTRGEKARKALKGPSS